MIWKIKNTSHLTFTIAENVLPAYLDPVRRQEFMIQEQEFRAALAGRIELSITAQTRLNDIKREAKIYLKGNKKYYQNKNMKWQEFNLSKNKAKEILKYIDLTSNEVYEFNY